MAKKKILVIGASACGAKAASRAPRLDPDAEITILSAGRYASVASCGLPYYVGGVVPDLYDLLRTANGKFRDPEFFRQLKDVDVRIGIAVGGIDRRGRRVFARDTSRNEDQNYHYDKLVLATGATPVRLTVPGVGLDGVHHLTRIEDAVALASRVRAQADRPAVVIGAGFIDWRPSRRSPDRGSTSLSSSARRNSFPRPSTGRSRLLSRTTWSRMASKS
jgi:NADPH-dependent 2,4-dienoyl-CoA reductase/sulfur reductase-like enzyme